MLEAMNGATSGHFEVKLFLTALTIGTGFVGGEVIPLLATGAMAGATFANLIGANVAVFAIVGSVAVLAGATNTPLACTFIGIELFGGNAAILFALHVLLHTQQVVTRVSTTPKKLLPTNRAKRLLSFRVFGGSRMRGQV